MKGEREGLTSAAVDFGKGLLRGFVEGKRGWTWVENLSLLIIRRKEGSFHEKKRKRRLIKNRHKRRLHKKTGKKKRKLVPTISPALSGISCKIGHNNFDPKKRRLT